MEKKFSFVAEILKLPFFQEPDTDTTEMSEEEKRQGELEAEQMLGEYLDNLPAFRELPDKEEREK